MEDKVFNFRIRFTENMENVDYIIRRKWVKEIIRLAKEKRDSERSQIEFLDSDKFSISELKKRFY